jgi:biopolymer transport protein ExbB
MTQPTDALLAPISSLLALADPAAGAGAPPPSHTLWDYIHSGGPVGYVLVTLSVVALGLIIANLIILRRSYLAPQRVVDALQPMLAARQLDQALQFCRTTENDCFLARVLSAGLTRAARSAFGVLELKPSLELAGQRELERLDKLTHGLRLIAEVAPMLGLLGTVFGMIGAFQEIGAASGGARSTRLSEFMSLALVTTAMGLILAVPATIAYALFKRRTDRVVSEVGDIAEALVATLQAPAQARPAASPVPVAATPNGSSPSPAASAPAR